MAKTLHFRSKRKYLNWLRAEKWATGGKRSKHPKRVLIRGKVHRVRHGG